MATSFVKGSSSTISKLIGSSTDFHSTVASGIPSLDSVFGYGIPFGSVTLIEEDEHAVYSKLCLKAFLSSGVYSKVRIVYAASDLGSPSEIVQIKVKPDRRTDTIGTENNMKIAFRYSDLPSQERNLSKDEEQVDFGTTITEQEIERNHLRADLIEPIQLKNLLNRLKQLTTKEPVSGLKTMVIVEDISKLLLTSTEDDITSLIFSLKSYSRTVPNCVVVISVNHRVLNSSTRNRLRNISDGVLQFDVFEEATKTYPDFEGVLNVHKLPKINTLNYAKKIETLDLGFQMKRNNRYLVVDKLCLPPELGDTPSRTSCNTTNKKLDF